ncbi:pectin lyase superfamily protein [Medicago truncatula]|uniref:Pectin lyase superfamily protein n=1 Tax=Medicago truncatula TaxID=3880 RepID=G7KCY9_MEDTR|nr:pectin lyase superfamily protein [Medicago truncatula]
MKSGWDKYGISYGRLSSSITIRHVSGSSPFIGIAGVSETSGRVDNVNDMGIEYKCVYIYGECKEGIQISGDVGDHPDDKCDLNALPIVKAGLIQGMKNSPFTDICLSDINLHEVNGTRSRTPSCKCSDVFGVALQVSPWPCPELISHQLGSCVSYY